MTFLFIIHYFYFWIGKTPCMQDKQFVHALMCVLFVVCMSFAPIALSNGAVDQSSITYATRIDSVVWSFQGSKFSCQISHTIDGFGEAIFERPAGLDTRFVLHSQSPRLKTGQANLVSQPPAWLNNDPSEKLAQVQVKESRTPVQIKRKVSERMLAELQKGMDLHVVRQPWYGDKQSLRVVISSIGFGKTYSDYLQCLSGLLPVNFSQVEKKSLYYDRGDKELRNSVKRYLEKVALYINEDESVKVIYIDGHTDSTGIRNENLLKSQQWAKKVESYLLAEGVDPSLLVVRWHGERYQIASNQTKAGKAKNRRVTIRLSKTPPKMKIDKPKEPVDIASAPTGAPQAGEKISDSQ